MRDFFASLGERFFELDPRHRLAGCVAVTLLAFGAYWYFVYADRKAETAATLATIEDLKAQRTRKLKLIENLDDARDAVRELTAEVRRAEVRLPDEKEIPDLLSTISSAVRESGLQIMLFRQQPERYHDFYAEVPVEVLVRGDYHQVATFFERVSRLDRIVNVSDISMHSPEEDRSATVVSTSCSAVTFRFLDEEERERLAKEREEEKRKKR